MTGAAICFWGAAALFAISFGLLVWVILSAFSEGAISYAGEYSDTTSRAFEDIFLFIPARRIAEAGWALAVMAFLLFAGLLFNPNKPAVLVLGLALGIVAAFGAFQLPRQLLAVMRTRRRRKFNEQLVEALGQMSNALRAGFSITQAFESVVQNAEKPIAQEFRVFLQQQRVGISFSDALEALDRRVGSEDLNLVCSAMEIARRTGGNLTEIFDKIALTIRERMRIERRVLTLTAQGRMQGMIVGSMPFLVGIGMAVLRPEIMMPFLRTPQGLAAVAAVLVLVAIGALVIRKIIKIDV
ncbi:MAG: type II secretion system F family protein [Kiritimatiellae bacterium]|jgi:tight adherence protein B|nr:type II secretion system F family protein [Kiritimatiellia bacterium]